MEFTDFLGALACLALFGFLSYGSIRLYFHFRSKHASSKWSVEIAAVAIALSLSIVVKFIVCTYVWKAAGFGKSFLRGITSALQAMYTGVAGLTFGDLMETEGLNEWLRIAYFASSAYAGLMILAVVTAKASYESYSYIRLKRLEHYKDVFVFTALNEQSLMMAKSIKRVAESRSEGADGSRGYRTFSERRFWMPEAMKQKIWTYRKRHPIIIFAGEDLAPFDRHNELCMEVMENDFLYWSYNPQKRKREQTEKSPRIKSIAQSLHLKNHNRNDPSTRFVVFAVAKENGNPQEEENFADIITDIETRIGNISIKNREAWEAMLVEEAGQTSGAASSTEKTPKDGKQEKKERKEQEKRERRKARLVRTDGMRIEYYILTKRETNHQSYQDQIDHLIGEYANATDILKRRGGEDPAKKEGKIREEAGRFFSVDVWNAADMVGTQVASYIHKKRSEGEEPPEEVKAWIIGFGNTGKAISKAIYQHTAAFTDGHANRFLADVFDKRGEECFGLFRQENPMTVCVNVGKVEEKAWAPYKEIAEACFKDDEQGLACVRHLVCEQATRKEAETIRNRLQQRLRGAYKDPNDTAWESAGDVWDREMSYPVYRFNGKPVLGLSFSETAEIALCEKETSLKTAPVFASMLEQKGTTESVKSLEAAIAEAKTRDDVPDYFVVATGEDYLNVKVANALVAQLVRHPETGKRTVFVKISNAKNNKLICPMSDVEHISEVDQKDEAQKKEFNEFKASALTVDNRIDVVIVGNDDYIFNYNHILKHKDYGIYQVNYNRAYEAICAAARKTKSEIDDGILNYLLCKKDLSENVVKYMKHFLKLITYTTKQRDKLEEGIAALRKAGEKTSEGFLKAMQSMKGGVEVYRRGEEIWHGTKFWDRVSSKEACLFMPTFRKAYDQNATDEKGSERMCELMRLEHQRWLRLHMVSGWSYAAVRSKGKRQHNCLVPVGCVPWDKMTFDLINVVLALKKDQMDDLFRKMEAKRDRSKREDSNE